MRHLRVRVRVRVRREARREHPVLCGGVRGLEVEDTGDGVGGLGGTRLLRAGACAGGVGFAGDRPRRTVVPVRSAVQHRVIRGDLLLRAVGPSIRRGRGTRHSSSHLTIDLLQPRIGAGSSVELERLAAVHGRAARQLHVPLERGGVPLAAIDTACG